MILFAILFLVFVGITAACWFQGLWSCAINIINLLLAMVIATNFWEPLADYLDGTIGKEQTYLLDPLLLWMLFSLSYITLRIFTGVISKYKVEFIMPVEMVGRTLLALWCGWLFTCFAAFTLLTAPVGASPVGAWSTPQSKSFLFLAPERQWLSFAQSRSLGALGRSKFSAAPRHVDEDRYNIDAEVFDPNSEFIYRYRARRITGST